MKKTLNETESLCPICLERIVEVGGSRCCKRCGRNKECLKTACPFFGGNADS